MASAYALPSHGYSKSHSGIYIEPSKTQQDGHGHARKSASNGNLFTHTETSRENSPYASPVQELDCADAFSFNTTIAAVQENHRNQPHAHNHSHSHAHSDHDLQHSHVSTTMKGRTRGESDLGRPADPMSGVYRPSLESIPTATKAWFSLPEALTAMLVPLPYILASAAYAPVSKLNSGAPLPISALDELKDTVLSASIALNKPSQTAGLLEACTLASGTLLLVGILGRIRTSERVLDRRKDGGGVTSPTLQLALDFSTAREILVSALSVSLPFYAAMKLGGVRTGLVLIAAIAADWSCIDGGQRPSVKEWTRTIFARRATLLTIAVCIIVDATGLTHGLTFHDLVTGYMALLVSLSVLPSPLPILPARPDQHQSARLRTSTRTLAVSPLIRSPSAITVTLVAGVLLSIVAVGLSLLLSRSPPISISAITLSTLSIACTAAAILFAQASAMRSQSKTSLALGCVLTGIAAVLNPSSFWPGAVTNIGLSAIVLCSAIFDDKRVDDLHAHDHEHTQTRSSVHKAHASGDYSIFTKFALSHCTTGGLVHSILLEKDSRRIAYFTCLNFAFMLVQGLYGYLSGSLGLLSDTVHMFFDCLGLVVGLGAAVASKWPTSPEMPYGWGKLNTLAGFGNGIFLMLVSVEFVWEAIEGMLEGTELRRVKELLVVSTLGFLVNMVGLFAFGHAHAGHDHGHGHSHGHAHSHDSGHGHQHDHDHIHDDSHHHLHAQHDHAHDHAHDHSHVHTPNHSLTNGHAHSAACSHTSKSASLDALPVPAMQVHKHSHDHGHGHSHDHNDNMHGIFLHVAADAGGSLAVILSTAMTLYSPWYLWDPLATILIAVLIFAAAVPLVISSGQKLLLVVPEQEEYAVKNCLQAIGEERGVVGVATPRFWVGDGEGKGICGVIHVIATENVELDEVRQRVGDLCAERSVDCLVHVERLGEEGCWCGGAAR